MRYLISDRRILTKNEVEELKTIGRVHGFENKHLRFDAYRKLFFIQRESYAKRIWQFKLTPTEESNLSEAEVIDKDAIRTHFGHFEGEELVTNNNQAKYQEQLAKMLKKFFLAYSKARYYQGLNSVMGMLQREYHEEGELPSIQIFEGLILHHLKLGLLTQ